MDIPTLEVQLVMMCRFTNTIEGCQTALKGLAHMERRAKTVEAADMLSATKDIVFGRGNFLRLEERGE